MKKNLSVLSAILLALVIAMSAVPAPVSAAELTSIRLSNNPVIDVSVSGRTVRVSGLASPQKCRMVFGGAEYPKTISGNTAYIEIQKGIADGVYTFHVANNDEVWTSIYLIDTGETLKLVTPSGYDEYCSKMEQERTSSSWGGTSYPYDNATEAIRKEARVVTSGIYGEEAKLEALYDNLLNKSYAYDTSLQNNTARKLYTNGSGTCKAFSEYLDIQAQEVGIESKLVVGLAKDTDTSTWQPYGDDTSSWGKHQWNMFRIKVGNTYRVIVADPTWDASRAKKGTKIRFYDVTDFVFAISHAYDGFVSSTTPSPQPIPMPQPQPVPVYQSSPQRHPSGAVYQYKAIEANASTVVIDTYTMDGVTYVKPRDFCYLLKDSQRPLDYFWSDANASLMLTKGYAITPNGTEMKQSGYAQNVGRATEKMVTQVGGQAKWQDFAAIVADGELYLSLRQLADFANVGVGWVNSRITLSY
ncbi:MAG: hypothetical protein LBE03_02085 [Candidatus Nomurabacteria bacterium]|jgi:hypothetical protein|nr:hypothetical protein [Candidatus Nomurabacteria bacterium]